MKNLRTSAVAVAAAASLVFAGTTAAVAQSDLPQGSQAPAGSQAPKVPGSGNEAPAAGDKTEDTQDPQNDGTQDQNDGTQTDGTQDEPKKDEPKAPQGSNQGGSPLAAIGSTTGPELGAGLIGSSKEQDGGANGSSNILHRIGNLLNAETPVNGNDILGSTQTVEQPAWATAWKVGTFALVLAALGGIVQTVGAWLKDQGYIK